MPQPKMDKFNTEIILGEKYSDEQTGIEGVATSVTFYQHSCERVCVEFLDSQGALKEYMFDAPRLIRMRDQRAVTSPRTGGSKDDSPIRGHGRR